MNIDFNRIMVPIRFLYKGVRMFIEFIIRFKGWVKLLQIIFSEIINIISNPSFIMFSFIAIGLGTLGIWIPLSPFNNNQVINVSYIDIIDKMSVFTFCVATLGNMATEYFFEEKNIQGNSDSNINNDDDYKLILSKHAAFFLWSLAFFLSFLCLKDNKYIVISLCSTLTLWLLVNINRPKFRRINQAALANLSPKLQRNGGGVEEFGGDGV